ncbi:MAG: phage tail assembly chaperone [Pseudomonas sp.]|jgi:hypothetical protein|uniref:tail fiber assembly protein n=1 Tax=Pseudomonas sp. TaxID=306 RepID=UPI00206F3416|nr:tail fiber assembly protein [Pseudomonas sp.]MDP9031189.1 phage tail assembly chaperone [Pseudomonadota bacterium]DAV57849.1 MAG TPA: tail assembly chaperone protein [Caudoviricetes sp.]MDE1909185.1 phage tail assembly chaperone [Pseudomonas sp.]MDE2190902.1 phage tail assembly chaperone [Pseudomonas sp.]MDE2555515.1 phage tail assembly chaperone [Pseudomonas sp.]
MSEASNVENPAAGIAVPTPEIEWAAVRSRRDQLLRATDFTQLPDYPATDVQRTDVASYRKALRDIPEQGAEPSKLVWPVLPTFLK